MNSSKPNRLQQLQQRLQGNNTLEIADEQFLLAKELGCLGEIIGREFEVTSYDKQGRIKIFRQKPMSIAIYMKLIDSLKKMRKMEEKQAKKNQRRRR